MAPPRFLLENLGECFPTFHTLSSNGADLAVNDMLGLVGVRETHSGKFLLYCNITSDKEEM